MFPKVVVDKMSNSLPSWLSQIEVIDSHVHVIDIINLNYGVVEFKTSPNLAKNWSETMYRADIGDIPIKKLIFVEVNACYDSMLKETQWVHSTMVQDPKSMFVGIVANVPVEQGKEAVAKWIDMLPKDSVCGIRRLIQDMPDGFCLTPDFIEGVKEVAKHNIVFELGIRSGSRPQQCSEILHLVKTIPECIFILDHIGKPNISGKEFTDWSRFITELSTNRNTFCKISGIITEAEKDWNINSVRPYVEHCLGAFGFERCLFGSDWFVCTLNGSLRDWFLVLCQIVDGATMEQKKDLFCETARRVYRLGRLAKF